MRASVVIPGIIDVPVIVEFGAVASSGVDLLPGDELSFRDIVVEELYFSTEEASLEPVQVDALEDFLRYTAQFIVDDSLDGARPTLPIPVFEVPDDLDEFGIPRGTALGVLDAILEITERHFVVEGNFGNR